MKKLFLSVCLFSSLLSVVSYQDVDCANQTVKYPKPGTAEFNKLHGLRSDFSALDLSVCGACELILWYGIFHSIWNGKIMYSWFDLACVLLPKWAIVSDEKELQLLGKICVLVNVARIVRNKIKAYQKESEEDEDIVVTAQA